jgi:hypothetical protein
MTFLFFKDLYQFYFVFQNATTLKLCRGSECFSEISTEELAIFQESHEIISAKDFFAAKSYNGMFTHIAMDIMFSLEGEKLSEFLDAVKAISLTSYKHALIGFTRDTNGFLDYQTKGLDPTHVYNAKRYITMEDDL